MNKFVCSSLLFTGICLLAGCQGVVAPNSSQSTTGSGGGGGGTTTVALTVTVTGTGSVTSSPNGISCPGTCTAQFNPNTIVTLSETATSGATFGGWSGSCTGMATCSFTITAASSVTALFNAANLQSLNHIIIFAQENRSFDHYFGYLRQYWKNNGIADQSFDGLPQFNPTSGAAPLQGPAPSLPGCDPTNPNGPTICTPDTSVTVPSFHMQSVCTEELSPFWDEAHVDWNYADPTGPTSPLNGFVIAGATDARQYPGGPVNDVNGYRTMGYFTDADLNYYYFMASSFATSDRWFAPMMSRTQLNRAFLLAATSGGYAYPPGSNSSDSQPLSATPIFEALQNAGITWKIYVNSDGTGCADTDSSCLIQHSYLNLFTYYSTVTASSTLLQNIASVNQYKNDVANGTLPQVALIEPASDAGLDEHPSDSDQYPVNIQDGANYVSGLINALMTSPSWKDSALIFTYDEPGGFYDHQPPQPAAIPDQYAYPIDLQTNDACDGLNATSGVCSFAMTGYRIPMFVVSPFAKKNYVSHTIYDSTAILTLIEKRFGLAALTARDKAQPDMSTDFFDFSAPWATPPSPPAQTTGGTCSIAAPTP